MRYLRERRAELGGSIPARRSTSYSLPAPAQSAYASQLKGSGKREISTTMALVRLLSSLVKDKQIGERVVPIVPDEARTFGMEGMFRQLGIYSSVGQQYTPHDAGQILYYKEEETGQILEEGINEAGAMSAWLLLPLRTRYQITRWCRSTSSTPCSDSSEFMIWRGLLAIVRREASLLALRRDVRL